MKTMLLITTAVLAALSSPAAPTNPPAAPAPPQPPMELESVEPGKPAAGREPQAWLGVGVAEADDALAAQLNLPEGGGLVVNYVTPESPAAKAGFHKHDVLARLNNHLLVHPAQLRKLIQALEPAAEVEIAYFRAGKSNTVRVALAKDPGFPRFTPSEAFWGTDLPDLRRELQPVGEEIRKSMEEMRRALQESGFNKEKLEREIRRGLEEARLGLEEALRASSNVTGRLLLDLQNRPFEMGSNSSVVVRREARGQKTIVKKDEEGTVSVIADPRKRAKVQDKAGRVVFEGEIETKEQMDSLPAEIRDRLQLLLKQLETEEPSSRVAPLRAPKEEAHGARNPARLRSSAPGEPGLRLPFSAVAA